MAELLNSERVRDEKMNKKLIVIIVVIIQICFIWQCVINPVRGSSVAGDSSSVDGSTPDGAYDEAAKIPDEGMGKQQTESEILSINVIEEFEQVTMEGQWEVQDNPWNTNSGLITLDSGEKCLFLTPNTGLMTPYLAIKEGIIEISFCIFEDVRDMSDGAGILLQLHDTEGNLLKEENIPVDAGQGWQEYSCEIDAEQADKVRLRIMCNNGGNDDDVCDWVMIRKAIFG